MQKLEEKVVATGVQTGAKALIKEMANEFSEGLLLGAKLRAVRDGSGLVLPKHVHEAAESVNEEHYRTKERRELRVALGGALFGAFIQGFITELAGGNRALVVVYTGLGLIGMFLVLWNFRR